MSCRGSTVKGAVCREGSRLWRCSLPEKAWDILLRRNSKSAETLSSQRIGRYRCSHSPKGLLCTRNNRTRKPGGLLPISKAERILKTSIWVSGRSGPRRDDPQVLIGNNEKLLERTVSWSSGSVSGTHSDLLRGFRRGGRGRGKQRAKGLQHSPSRRVGGSWKSLSRVRSPREQTFLLF